MSDIQKMHLQEDGRVFIDLPDSLDNPCFDCGLCCSHYRVSFYIGEMDTQPGGFVPSGLVKKLNDVMACMSGTEHGFGLCDAFEGKRGFGGRCGIYENRPSPCREFPLYMDDGSLNPECTRLKKLYSEKENKTLCVSET